MFVIRNGEQVLREYNPAPANPSTSSQVEARAKLKLLSQLSAVMAPVIAIPRIGAVSSRNRFLKENYALASYTNNEANIELNNVQLTKSVVGLPAVSASLDGYNLDVELGVPDAELSRVVYCVFIKDTDNKLRFSTSSVVSAAGANNSYPVRIGIGLGGRPIVVYAYGVRDNTDAARATFGNMTTPTAQSVAMLIVSRTLTDADITLTETRGITVNPTT